MGLMYCLLKSGPVRKTTYNAEFAELAEKIGK
jgi:hypothetical protein